MAIRVIPVNSKVTVHWYWFPGIKNSINFNSHAISAFKKKKKGQKNKPTNSKQSIFLICAFVADHKDMQVLRCSVAGPGPRREKQAGHLGSLAPICTLGGGPEGAPQACLVSVSKSAVVLTMLKSFSSHLNSANSRQPRLFGPSSSYAMPLEPCSWDF